MPSYKQLAKYIIGFGGVQGLSILVSIVRNKFVSLLLGPGGMGLISLYQTGLTFVQNATNFGLPQSSVRTVSVAADECGNDGGTLAESIRIIRSWIALAALLGLCVCMMLSGLLSYTAFANFDHTLDFLLLAPFVFFACMTGGEMAVLKATHRLKKVAQLSLLNVMLTLLTSIPMFYLWGTGGIIPSLLLGSVLQFALTAGYSYRLHRPDFSFSRSFLKKGRGLIVLGLAFVAAGILGSGVEFGIRAFLNNQGGEEAVGLYNAGYMMAFTYVGIVFAAFESEYFPRLSRLLEQHDRVGLLHAVKRQIKISLAFVIPLVAVLIPLLPYVVPLLFSNRFADAVPMAQITMLAMVLRAIALPVEYIPLAKGDSKGYLTMEAVYDILLLVLVCTGYHLYGIPGTGCGIIVSYILSVVFDILYVRKRYL